MDDQLYDEFGNYVGPDLSSSSEEEEEDAAAAVAAAADADEGGGGELDDELDRLGDEVDRHAPRDDAETNDVEVQDADEDAGNAIVLAEDKKYYPTADEVFGEDTEALVEEEDAQAITEPIIAPVKHKRIEVVDEDGAGGLQPRYDVEYFAGALLSTPQLVRNVAVVGHLSHGKTTLLDLVLDATHDTPWRAEQLDVRCADSRRDERERGLSFKMHPVSVLVPDLRGKSFGVNFFDVPGHVNFFDEAVAAMQLSDGVLLALDVAEGVMVGTRLALQHALSHGLAVTVVLTKIDRLILELRLPPADAYFKIRHVLDELNELVDALPGGGGNALSPLLGNVLFAGARSRWCFSLESFAEMYLQQHPELRMPPAALARRLWGDVWYDRTRRVFTKRQPAAARDDEEPRARSFVEFVLEPLYKLHSMLVGEDVDVLAKKMERLGVMQRLRRSDLRVDVQPLLRLCLGAYFDGSLRALGQLVAHHIPSAAAGAAAKVRALYTGPLDGDLGAAMSASSRDAPCTVMVSKLLPTADASAFLAVGRVMSGALRVDADVRVLGRSYDPELDVEDQVVAPVRRLFLGVARYRVEVREARAGQVVLIDGVAESMVKGGTLAAVDERGEHEEVYVFRPLADVLSVGVTSPVVRLAVEPLRPSEQPKMVEGLRSCVKTYGALQTRVELSGEHVLIGTGELYVDNALRDLRDMFSEIEIKVSDPAVLFVETASETSSLRCFAESANKRNKLTMIAEPLEDGLAEHIEAGHFADFAGADMHVHARVQAQLRERFDWDILAARSLWAFGPDARRGPNCLLDDVLPGGDSDKELLAVARESIVRGFQWSTREGPLCDEPVRGVKFRILESQIADDPLSRNGAQVVPMSRRVAFSSFLTASPRLMEPVYFVEVLCPAESVAAVYNILARRRGFVIEDAPKPGTPMFVVRASLPVLDSFGFETDLRTSTQGQAFCSQWFERWAVMPGDPVDRTVQLQPLQPSPPEALARECMVKTRRRKGLGDDVSIGMYFDDPLLLELAQQDLQRGG